MEEKKGISKGIVCILILFTFILALTLGYFLPFGKSEKVNCNDKTEVENNEKKEVIDVENILSMILIKHDVDNVYSYKISELSETDINTIIANYLFSHGNSINDGEKFEFKASELEDKLTKFLGLKNHQFDVSKGSRYTGHTLKVIDKNGVRYYEIGRNENSHASNGDSYRFWNLKNINYRQNKLIIDCEIANNFGETPLHEVIGNAVITIDMSDGMVLESFNYSKYDNPLKVDTSGLNF